MNVQLRRPQYVLAVTLLLCALPAAGADPFYVQSSVSATGGVTLTWSRPGSNFAFAVESRATLQTGAWAYPGPVDQWPVVETNWTAGTNAAGFYRLSAVQRGRLLGNEFLGAAGTNEIDQLFQLAGIPLTATYAVAVYQLVYETFDHRGQAGVGSGALVVPEGAATAPLLSYQHGTLFLKNDAPSVPGSLEQLLGVAVASAGYAVAQPDYLGLGTNSPPVHPFLHARSEAIAAVDLLRAGRAFIQTQLPFALTDQLFLIGYSQGGHATLALQRELEQRHTNEFAIAASAPMAGPYDLSGVMGDLLATPAPYSSPAYIPYLLFGYNSVYGLFDDPAEVFVSPYDATLPPLFDGLHDAGAINAAMPAVPQDALQPAYLAAFTNNAEHPLRVALRANDLWDWTPRAPTRLYHCSGDTVVPFENSRVATNHFLMNGATNVVLIDPLPGADHGDCALPAVLDAKAWFDSLKDP